MTHTKLLLAASSAFALLAAPSQAKTALIDIGNASGTVTSSGGLTCNAPVNLSGTPKTTAIALNSTTGVSTGWSANVTQTSGGATNAAFSGGGGTYNGTLPAAVSGYDPNATRDNIYFYGTDSQLTVSLTGLDNTRTYDLLLYGSRASSGGTQTWNLITGTGTAPEESHAPG